MQFYVLDDIKKLSQTNVELSSSWIFTKTFKRSLNKISDIFFQENGSQNVVCGLNVVCGHFVQPLMCLPHIYTYIYLFVVVFQGWNVTSVTGMQLLGTPGIVGIPTIRVFLRALYRNATLPKSSAGYVPYDDVVIWEWFLHHWPFV